MISGFSSVGGGVGRVGINVSEGREVAVPINIRRKETSRRVTAVAWRFIPFFDSVEPVCYANNKMHHHMKTI